MILVGCGSNEFESRGHVTGSMVTGPAAQSTLFVELPSLLPGPRARLLLNSVLVRTRRSNYLPHVHHRSQPVNKICSSFTTNFLSSFYPQIWYFQSPTPPYELSLDSTASIPPGSLFQHFLDLSLQSLRVLMALQDEKRQHSQISSILRQHSRISSILGHHFRILLA